MKPIRLKKTRKIHRFMLPILDRERLIYGITLSSIRLYKAIAKIPERDLWIYNNPEALETVWEGIKQIENGQVHRRSFK